MEKETNISCWLLLAYGLVFAFFQIMPALLPSFLKKPLTWGDILDFLTPWAVIPLAYLLYWWAKNILLSPDSSSGPPSLAGKIILAAGFISYINGHGLHLSANAIARLFQEMKGTEIYKATYLFDEVISHFMWDGGVFLISLGLIILAFKLPFQHLSGRNLVFLLVGAACYGFTFTVDGIEGQTVIFTLPAAFLGCLLSLALYLKGHRKGFKNPFFIFFALSYLISLILFAYWGLTYSGFPQFSELGWIR